MQICIVSVLYNVNPHVDLYYSYPIQYKYTCGFLLFVTYIIEIYNKIRDETHADLLNLRDIIFILKIEYYKRLYQ